MNEAQSCNLVLFHPYDCTSSHSLSTCVWYVRAQNLSLHFPWVDQLVFPSLISPPVSGVSQFLSFPLAIDKSQRI